MAQCCWYQGSFRCRQRARYRLSNGAVTCGAHERRRRNPRTSTKRIALDLVDVDHILGPYITQQNWAQVFYRNRSPYDPAVERAFLRWKKQVRALGLVKREFMTRGDRSRLVQVLVLDIPRAHDLARRELGEVRPFGEQRLANVPTMDEIVSGRGVRTLEDWRTSLPLRDPVESGLLAILADQQSAFSAKQLADYVTVGARGRRIRGGEAAARRALEALVRRGFVEPVGRERRAVTYKVTVTGYEAALVDRQLRAEALGEAVDPEAQAEAFYARQAARARGERKPRTRTVVMPHAGKRSCNLCGIAHSLAAHRSHRVEGERRLVDMLGQPVGAPAPRRELAGPVADASFDFGANLNPQPMRGPHPRCQQGLHDFDETTWRCRRRGCTSQREEGGQGLMFGVDPARVAEAEARRRASGQGELWNPLESGLLAVVGARRRVRQNPAHGLLAVVGVGNPPWLDQARNAARRGDARGVHVALQRLSPREIADLMDESGASSLLPSGGLSGASLVEMARALVAAFRGFNPPACYFCGAQLVSGSDVCTRCWAGQSDENPPFWLGAATGAAAVRYGPGLFEAARASRAWVPPALAGAAVGGGIGFVAGKATATARAISDVIGLGRSVVGGARRAASILPNPRRFNPTNEGASVKGVDPKDQWFVGEVSVEQARQLAEADGPKSLALFEETLRDGRTFHGAPIQRFRVYRVPDRSKTLTREWAFATGRAPETRYHDVPKGSNKHGVYWIHKHPRGSEPLEAILTRSGLPVKVGGTFRVKGQKWWYD